MSLAPRNLPAIREAQQGAQAYVPHVDLSSIHRMIEAAHASRYGERDGLLIAVLFDGCLRVSEALRLRPADLVRDDGGWSARILGKGGKMGQVALSPSLVTQLHAYAFQTGMERDGRFFPVTRVRAHQIVARAFEDAGVAKSERVGAVHVLRHIRAIARLERRGTPRRSKTTKGTRTSG